MGLAAGGAGASRVRACVHQSLVIVLINVPAMSFGLAMGWVSLVSGEAGEESGEGEAQVVAAAATTFVASLAGVPLCARVLAAGRKRAVLATSAAFLACWALKLCGTGWWLMCARACAGLGGAGAWLIAPLLATEMCAEKARGAAAAALVVAHNVGFLLMYVAAEARVPHRSVEWWCAALAAAHCALYLLVPESPHHLAAAGKPDEARAALAWLRGAARDHPALDAELRALPPPAGAHHAPLQLTRDMLGERGRRRAFLLCLAGVVGQEACGVLTLLQFAERVFVAARAQPGQPARHAVLLGAAQLFASLLALYLVETVGRKRLMVWGGVLTGCGLCAGAAAVWAGATGTWAACALTLAVLADSGGLQPAPYAMLADTFEYEYRGCVVALVSAAAWAGNALEVVVFPLVARGAGLGAALALGGVLALALALFAALALPETRGRTPQQIYNIVCPPPPPPPVLTIECCSKRTISTKL